MKSIISWIPLFMLPSEAIAVPLDYFQLTSIHGLQWRHQKFNSSHPSTDQSSLKCAFSITSADYTRHKI